MIVSRLLVLAATQPAHGGGVTSSLPSGHMFWIGVTIGLLVGLIPLIPWWLKIVGLGFAVVASGIVHVAKGGHVTPGVTTWLVVGLVGLGIGLYFGRDRALRHLGGFEYGVRRRNIKTISRF